MPFKNPVPCGLVYCCTTFDNIFHYEPVPLQNVHLDVKLVNFSSEVTITQKFVNKEANPIECIYYFPVEEEAAVVDFTAELEGRSIKTQIKENQRQDMSTMMPSPTTKLQFFLKKPSKTSLKSRLVICLLDQNARSR